MNKAITCFNLESSVETRNDVAMMEARRDEILDLIR